MNIHYMEPESMKFSPDSEYSDQTEVFELVTAVCTCGFEYRVTGRTLSEAISRLEQMYNRHLSEMRQLGEPTVR